MNKPVWTEEEDAQLEELWCGSKLSATEIGGVMGRSKNGVIGRAHRLDLIKKKSGGSRPGRKAKKKVKETVPILKVESPKQPSKPFIRKPPSEADRKPPQYIAPTQRWTGDGVPLLEATRDQCRAIMGSSDDARGLAICCGKPIREGTGLSFCSDHYAAYTSRYWSR